MKNCPLLFLLLPFLLPAQEPTIPFLPYSTIGEPTTTDLFYFQDSKGFIWGIRDNYSIIRYDGYGFECFSPNEEDSSAVSGCPRYPNQVEFLEDRYGKIWILSFTGCLDRFDPETGRFESMAQRLGNQFSGQKTPGRFQDILQDRQGKIWISTENLGVVRYDLESDRFTPFTSPGWMPLLFEDANGRIWGFLEKGENNRYLYQLNPDTRSFEKRIPVPMPPQPIATGINNRKDNWVRLDDHSFLLDINHQLYLFDLQDQTILPFSIPKKEGERTFCIFGDERSIWIGTTSGRILQFDTALSNSQVIHDPGPDQSTYDFSQTIGQLFSTQEGMLWFTCGGETRYLLPDESSFQRQPLPKPMPGVSKSIFQGGSIFPYQGKVWFNTYPRQKQVHPDGKETTAIPLRWPGKEQDTLIVYQFTSDATGNLWVVATDESADTSSQLSIRRFDPEGNLQLDFFCPLPHQRHQKDDPYLRQVKTDSHGQLWLFSGYELWRVDPARKACIPILFDSSFINRFHWDFWVDRNDNLWVGPYRRNGEDGKWEVVPPFSEEKSKKLRNVRTFFESSNGQIWLGTYAGAVRWDPETETSKRYLQEKRLVLRIFEDQAQNIWAIADGSLCRYLPEEDRFVNFSWRDGFRMSDFPTELWIDQTGYVYFRTTKRDINLFHPDDFHIHTTVSSIFFTRLELFDNPIQPGDSTGLLQKTLDFTGEIRLQYAQNDFTIHYTAPEFIHNEELAFAVKLEGFHDDWQEVGAKREARFTNLSPGRYTFKVKVRNHHGFWSETPRTLQIRVLPPWYRTNLAYIAWIALILGTIYAVYRYQLRRRLAIAEAARLKELDLAKTQLYTNITHEFRTPLTIILGMADQMKNDPKSWFNEGLRLIRRNGKQLLHLVNQMLDLSKLESGQMTLKPVNGDIVAYLHYLTESFHSYADSKDIRLHFSSEFKSLDMDFDPEKMQHLLSNLLSNAIKFTQAGGDVYLDVKEAKGDKQTITLIVRDNGSGIAPEHLPHIFDRFYQVDASATRRGEGTGIGLALTKELVQLMGGRIEVESELHTGTKFSIHLPVTRQAPRPEPTDQEIAVADTLVLETASIASAPDVPPSDRPLVLLIEDNADVITYLRSFLGGEYQIETATNGQEGIDKALELIPDLVVSDVMMPEKDGFEVCAALKTDERTSHIPVILLTARSDDASKLEGLTHGADAYLAKPFQQEELLVRIENLIALRRKLQERYQQTGHFRETLQAPIQTPDEAFLKKVFQIIEDNLGNEDFGMPQICKAVHMSRSNLFRKLKALTGRSATYLIRSSRLEKGKELLETTHQTVAEISFQVGFSDPSYFSKAFKEEFGVWPSEMRGQNM